MEILIILFLTFILFLFITLKNRKIALKFTLFLVPYNLFSYSYLFGINNAAIYGLFMGNIVLLLMQKNNYFNINDKKIKYIFILFFISLVISVGIMIFGNVLYQQMFFYTRTVTSTTSYFILNLLTGPILFLLLANSIKELNELYDFIYIFLLSTTYLFVSWLGYYFNYKLPYFLSYRMQGGGYVPRFTGLWGDYELVAELCFIYIILSLAFILSKFTSRKRKNIVTLVLLLSILISLSTATRSLFFMSIIFFLIFFITYPFTRRLIIFNKVRIALVLVGVIFIVILSISTSDLFMSRLLETQNIIKSTNYIDFKSIGLLMNRNFIDTYYDIYEVGAILGVGPFMVSTFRGSWMVYHNLYYHIVLSFGLTGLIIYFLFLFSNMKKLLQVAYRYSDSIYFLIFSLLLTLHIDQFKINYWRDSPTIQIYWFIFAISFLLAKIPSKTLNEKNTNYPS